METEKKSNGALIGLVIIVIILIIGGIYMWQNNQNTPATESPIGEVQTSTDTSVTTQDSTDLDNLDKDLQSVDTNIEASAINSVQ